MSVHIDNVLLSGLTKIPLLSKCDPFKLAGLASMFNHFVRLGA